MLAWVVPTFAQVFKGFGATLPAPTRFVLALPDALMRFESPTALGALAVGAGGALLGRGPPPSRCACLSAPPLLRILAPARWSRTLGTLLRGERLAAAMCAVGCFPAEVVQPIAVAEESGTLDAMLADIASLCERRVDEQIGTLTSLCEPLVVIVLRALMGATMVVAMYLLDVPARASSSATWCSIAPGSDSRSRQSLFSSFPDDFVPRPCRSVACVRRAAGRRPLRVRGRDRAGDR